MNKHLRFIYLLLVLCFFNTRITCAQESFGSEAELKKQASKLFEAENFEEAYPLYTQLASIYPKDYDLNYRLGVCMLFATEDKERPITFLEYAVGKPDVEKESYFYLAKAYHLNYRFDDAIKQYFAYKKVASSTKATKLMVDRQIEMCKNGKKLLRNLTELQVIDKKEMPRTDFYRSYDVSDIGGKLLLKPDEPEFKTELDKKKNEVSVIYLASNNNQIFFSSYGKDAKQGKDIYLVRKLPSGEWSAPQSLGSPINTEFDEDFPFLHPNGKVLYFCSKGHNSMGGYDIFKSVFNDELNAWAAPVNVDFPINTPDDDILYITNTNEKEAYFSSARASKKGETAVYHINSERKPLEMAFIKGAVLKNRDEQSLDVKITVKDMLENSIVGIFNAEASDGSYSMSLPKAGKFLFTVEVNGFATQSDIVEITPQLSFKPLRQEISYELGTDKLAIKNVVDDVTPADESYLASLSFIKQKAKMEVSEVLPEKDTLPTTPVVAQNNTTGEKSVEDLTPTKTKTKLTNDDIIKIAYADAEEVAQELVELKEQAGIALVVANQKNESAQNKTKEVTQLMSDAAAMEDNFKKQETINQANLAKVEAEELNQETVAAFNLAKKIEYRVINKQKEADLSLQYAKDLEVAVKSKTSAETFAKLDEQQKKLDELSEQNNNPTLVNSLKIDVAIKKEALEKAIQTTADIKQEIAENEALIVTTQAEADKEKNDRAKQGLLDQIAGLKQDIETSKQDLVQNDIKIEKLQKEYNGIVNETELVGSVLEKAKVETSASVAASVAAVDKQKLEAQVNTIKNLPSTPSTTTPTITNANVIVATNQNNNDSINKVVANNSNDNKIVAVNKETPKDTSVASATKIIVDTANVVGNVIDTSKTQSVAVTNTKTEAITSNENNINTNNVSGNTTITQASVGVTSADQIIKANTINQEADVIVAQSNELKAKAAATNDLAEKNELFAQAEELTKKAQTKKLEAAQIIAEANKTEYINNQNELDKLSVSYAKNEEDEVFVAGMLKDEAILYFDKSQKARQAANETNSYASKQSSLEEANANEKIALEKQQKAIVMYKKYQPASSSIANQTTTTTKPIASSTVVPENTNTIATKSLVVNADTTNNSEPTKAIISNNNVVDPATNPIIAAVAVDSAINKSTNDPIMLVGGNNKSLVVDSVKQEITTVATSSPTQLLDTAANSSGVPNASNIVTNEGNTTKQVESPVILTKTEEQPKSDNVIPNNTTATDIISNVSKDEIVIKKSVPLYSAAKPIPVNEKLPEGLVFKVQIGAFRNPIPQDLFKGMSPIMGETTPKGFIRYTAGLFKKFTTADQIKQEIRNLGYKDAFVVAFYNGKRIPIYDAIAMSGETATVASANNNITNNTTPLPQNDNTTSLVNQSTTIASNTNNTTTTPRPNNQVVVNQEIAVAQSVTAVGGLFYTIQVGVYSQPVQAAKLNNVQPLYNEVAPNGKLRYNVGVYDNLPLANEAKNKLVSGGMKDAFVVAYYNGKRISTNEATLLIKQGTAEFSKGPNVNVMPTFDAVNVQQSLNSTPVNTAVTTNSPSINNSQAPSIVNEQGLVFKVQIGAFKEEVPLDMVNKFLKIGKKGVANYTDEKGLTIYTVGICKTYEEAEKIKAEVLAEADITDAFVVAYNNGKKISLEEAKTISK